MFTIDTSTQFGARLQRHLRNDAIAWLVTVDADGMPQPSPVWFLWDADGSLLMYSEPTAKKVRNIRERPRVAIHFNGDANGGDIAILTGCASVDATAPRADAIAAYVEKYRDGLLGIGMTPEAFADAYTCAIRFVPERSRGH